MRPAPPFSVEARKRDVRFIIYKQNADGTKGREVAWVYAETLEAAVNAAMLFFKDVLTDGVVVEPLNHPTKKVK